MRTKLILLAAFLFTYFFSRAQKSKFSEYGEPTNEEIKMKECSFDKDANAVILLNEAASDYDDKYQLVTDHHVRIKILNKKGFEAANIKILYWRKDDFENIYDIEGMTINSDENGSLNKIKLEKSSIFKQKKTERFGEISLAFPSIVPGSIVEYRYQSVMKHYGGLDDWRFQDELPVVMSRYNLVIVPNTEFAYGINKRSDMPITIKPSSSDGSIYFEMQQIPGLNDEPYMDAREDYIQKVTFQLSGYNYRDYGKKNYMNSWNDVINELINQKEFGEQLKKNIPGTSDFTKQASSLPAEDKMKAVYDYVRSNMRWNAVYSKYALDGLKSAWDAKEGNSGEINLLLVNLLKDAGLEVYPILVSERFHGKVNTQYPFIDQFNSVFACVVIDEKKYFLDATDKFTPAHLVPYNLLNTTALIVNKKKGGLINILNDSLVYSDDILTKLNVSESGTLSGETTVKSKDYARVMRLMNYKEDEKGFMTKYFRKDAEVSITDFKMEHESQDSIELKQLCSFKCNTGADGNYEYIPLDLFSGFNENPFLSEKRFSNINFGYKRIINIQTTVSYPKNYIVDAIPKVTKIVNAENDIIISRHIKEDKENNLIYCTIVLEFKNSLYPPEAYLVIREIYKKMFDMLKEPLVLKKK